jgi:hypothetical protein
LRQERGFRKRNLGKYPPRSKESENKRRPHDEEL